MMAGVQAGFFDKFGFFVAQGKMAFVVFVEEGNSPCLIVEFELEASVIHV